MQLALYFLPFRAHLLGPERVRGNEDGKTGGQRANLRHLRISNQDLLPRRNSSRSLLRSQHRLSPIRAFRSCGGGLGGFDGSLCHFAIELTVRVKSLNWATGSVRSGRKLEALCGVVWKHKMRLWHS